MTTALSARVSSGGKNRFTQSDVRVEPLTISVSSSLFNVSEVIVMQGHQSDLGRPRNREEVVEKLYATMQAIPGLRFGKLVGRTDDGDVPQQDWQLDDYYIIAAEDIRFSSGVASISGPLTFGIEAEIGWIDFLLKMEQEWYQQRMVRTAGKTQRVDYYAYIQSDGWRQKANQAKTRAGHRCQVCNRSGSEVQLDAHHRTYERLGNEIPEDITVLCRDCHSLYEANKKLQNRPVLADAPIDSSPAATDIATALPIAPKEIPISVVGSNEFRQQVEPEKHLLARMGMVMYWAGFLGNALWILAIEADLIWNNWLQLINPLNYLQLFFAWITSALFWQLALVTIVGFCLMVGGALLVSRIKPECGTLHWYWRWSLPALAKVPFFLLVTANALLLVGPLLSNIAYVVTRQPTVTQFPMVLPILNAYLALLPLPLVHLVWDNSYRSGWGKLAITIAALAIVLVLSFMVAVSFSVIVVGW